MAAGLDSPERTTRLPQTRFDTRSAGYLAGATNSMGQMRFVIPQPERLVPNATELAYLAGAEGIPWECQTVVVGNALIIERDTRESGYLYFPWVVEGRGLLMLCSGSLLERPRPYCLPIELARGTLNRVRNQASNWQAGGMVLPDSFDPLLTKATGIFARAATGQDDPAAAADKADEAIRVSLDAADILVQSYTDQVLAHRRNLQVPMGTLVGARLQKAPDAAVTEKYAAAFNMAMVAPHWPETEPQLGKFEWDALDAAVDWCRDNNIRLCFGPLMQFDRHLVPDWLFLDDDFEEVQISVLDWIEALVKRYRGRVQLWNVAARMNQEGAFGYSEEQRLRLVVEAVDRVRALDPKTPQIMTFDQPWGEYIAAKDQELTPLHFADTLVRGELGLAGVGFEINMGYWPGGTSPRDALEISRQIDRWSQLGIPLVIVLSLPSGQRTDPQASGGSQVLPEVVPGGATPQSQQATLEWLFPLLLAKHSVQAIFWNHLHDGLAHDFPNGGLVTAAGKTKPALIRLAHFRKELIT